jgi:serine protease
MIRRTCVISTFVFVVCAMLAAPGLAAPGVKLTVVPPKLPVAYPLNVAITGSLTENGLPLAGETVRVGQTAGGVFTEVVSVTTHADGTYEAWVKPTVNATWTALWGDVPGDQVAIPVAPRVRLALSHLQSGKELTEVFSGGVGPSHAGSSVLVQKAVGAQWKTVARGRLDANSHYRIVWTVPFKTATYTLRAILPEHADNAQGTSIKAKLKVVIR